MSVVSECVCVYVGILCVSIHARKAIKLKIVEFHLNITRTHTQTHTTANKFRNDEMSRESTEQLTFVGNKIPLLRTGTICLSKCMYVYTRCYYLR